MVTHRTLQIAATLAAVALLSGCERPRHRHLWAIGADASSSGTTMTDYTALQATGAPDVSGCADDPKAWSPATANGTAPEYLVLTYAHYVHVTDIRIYETFNPGAIVQVDVEASDASVPPATLFSDVAGDGNPGCPTVFHISVNGGATPDMYDRVAIYFNPSLIGDADLNGTLANDFPEIDAAELVGHN